MRSGLYFHMSGAAQQYNDIPMEEKALDDENAMSRLRPSGVEQNIPPVWFIQADEDESTQPLEETSRQLTKIRSRSVELPRLKSTEKLKTSGGFRTHFVNGELHVRHPAGTSKRPGIARRSHSFNPSLIGTRSITRSVSSFSLYDKFAGERFDVRRPRTTSNNTGGREKGGNTHKKNHHGDKASEEISTNPSEEASEERVDQPQASTGKAMFMFLKAFIGSGVLFLPKALVFLHVMDHVTNYSFNDKVLPWRLGAFGCAPGLRWMHLPLCLLATSHNTAGHWRLLWGHRGCALWRKSSFCRPVLYSHIPDWFCLLLLYIYIREFG
ncbi:hypothetical protein EC973_006566 [Apophysomyces ossiformis]|uniref:Uncharacterized protein n=1 Tax=Apophysomyces ossiformis TaxID=679940 RepID=A0A8H7BQI3_9FUNG|nr:hypothetical protein EC973_006566 [Apophysomyces ossiformis]